MKRMKPWLRGGLIGVAVCIALFLFYIFVYFPIGSKVFNGMLPYAFLLLPLITGHVFVVMAHFVLPYGWMCQFTEVRCQEWRAVEGCVNEIARPTAECANMSEWVGLGLLALTLLVLYFVVGAAIATFLSRRKKKKK